MNDTGVIDFLYETAVIKAATQEVRRTIHVSDLTQDCMRKTAYRLRGFTPEPLSFKQAVPLVHGTALHEKISLGGDNEVSVSAIIANDEIKGTIDDIIKVDDKIYIIDKKTTAKSIPKKIPAQYEWQLNIYKLLYYMEKKVDIKYGAICWIDKSSGWKNHKTYIVELLDNQNIMEYVLCKLAVLSTKRLPAKVTSPLCNYCPFFKECKPF